MSASTWHSFMMGEMDGNFVVNALERGDFEQVGEHFLMHMG